MPRRILQIALGCLVVVSGVALVFSPLAVAEVLHRPHETSSQMINLRATWGGSIAGLGAFVAWLRPGETRRRVVAGLLAWLMACIGLARAVGFVLDGGPDGLQWLWLVAEIILTAGGIFVLRTSPRGQTS